MSKNKHDKAYSYFLKMKKKERETGIKTVPTDIYLAGFEDCEREYEEKLQKQKETILSILGHGDPYPLETVLEKLKWATEYLLHKKNYDGHSYEELGQSVRRANEILSILNTREAHFL